MTHSPRVTRKWAIFLLALLVACLKGVAADSNPHAANTNANFLAYFDNNDPFYVGVDFPKLTTPQWIGEPGIDAVVILAVDDMTETGRYEAFLRPILQRLKQIDGHAPVSIMTRSA